MKVKYLTENKKILFEIDTELVRIPKVGDAIIYNEQEYLIGHRVFFYEKSHTYHFVQLDHINLLLTDPDIMHRRS